MIQSKMNSDPQCPALKVSLHWSLQNPDFNCVQKLNVKLFVQNLCKIICGHMGKNNVCKVLFIWG